MLSELKALKVTELRVKLASLKLPTQGKKEELIERLVAHHEQQQNLKNSTAVTSPKQAVPAAIKSPQTATPKPQESEVKSPTSDRGQQPNSLHSPHVPMTEDEKKMQRAQRFNLPVNEEIKKVARSQRFSITSLPDDLEKLKKRQDRFNFQSSVIAAIDGQEKIQKRIERFGFVKEVTAVAGAVDSPLGQAKNDGGKEHRRAPFKGYRGGFKKRFGQNRFNSMY